ncbi:hypothetical protein QO004_004299 [Rhizobium mesoamericanum]|nr:hypothetical protein [Rhizobium mesoamericanum]MDQ0562494.1 hypothetical protein [Rhizobium mesoamericanum]
MGEDAEMQQLAASTLPVVLDHLRSAQELNAMLAGAGASIRTLPTGSE